MANNRANVKKKFAANSPDSGEYMANRLTNAIRHQSQLSQNDRQIFVGVRKHSRSFVWRCEYYATLTLWRISCECKTNTACLVDVGSHRHFSIEYNTNYRPISLLPKFSKILEKLFLTRINGFLCANNILSSSQYGFRTKLSTSLAVVELIEEITNATDNKKHAIGVFIDLKKAFDTVDHGILIKKNWNIMVCAEQQVTG